MVALTPSWLLQQLIPPALLTYSAWAWRRCTWTIGGPYLINGLHRPYLGAAYILAANILIPTMTTVFLRLYFLPATQSVPPDTPPREITALTVVFECSPPRQQSALRNGYALIQRATGPRLTSDPTNSLLPHCSRAECHGRWKPARARHCSECGVCRAGYDHHCAFFANCLTSPYLPAFLALCFITPLTVVLLSTPVYYPLAHRIAAAWRESGVDPRALAWWSWKPSWVVAGGPVGRWVGGLVLGWRALDAVDGGGLARSVSLEIGCICVIGNLLAAITLALGWSTYSLIQAGELTVDKERARAARRVQADIAKLGLTPTPSSSSQPLIIPSKLVADLNRFAPQQWFFVPTASSARYAGVLLPSLPHERPYDLGADGNVKLAVTRGRGWLSWLLPWNAVREGMTKEEIMNWPLAPGVEERLRGEAEKRVRAAPVGEGSGDDGGDDGDDDDVHRGAKPPAAPMKDPSTASGPAPEAQDQPPPPTASTGDADSPSPTTANKADIRFPLLGTALVVASATSLAAVGVYMAAGCPAEVPLLAVLCQEGDNKYRYLLPLGWPGAAFLVWWAWNT